MRYGAIFNLKLLLHLIPIGTKGEHLTSIASPEAGGSATISTVGCRVPTANHRGHIDVFGFKRHPARPETGPTASIRNTTAQSTDD
jgi:hypothetical protein